MTSPPCLRTSLLPCPVEDFEKRQPASQDTAPLEARATSLANGEIPDADTMPAVDDHGIHDTDGLSSEAEHDGTGVDPVLLDIFESEAETHLQTLREFLESAGDKASVAYTDNLSRALHTLKGSAHTAGIAPIAAVITPLERFVKESRAQNKRANQEIITLIAEACEFLTQGLRQLRQDPQAPLAGTDAYLERLSDITTATLRSHASVDDESPRQQSAPQLVQLFLNEGLDILLDADHILDEWAADPGQTTAVEKLRTELHQLTNGAQEAGLADVAGLSDALGQIYERAGSPGFTPDEGFFTTVRAAHEQLINMIDQRTESGDELIAELDALSIGLTESGEPQPDAFEQEFTGDLEEIDLSFDMEEESLPTVDSEQPPLVETDEDMDQELAEIFLEERPDKQLILCTTGVTTPTTSTC